MSLFRVSPSVMFPRKVLGNLLLPKIVYYESTRGLRGAVTVPLKLVKDNVPKRKKNISFADKEFKQLEEGSVGIAHALRSRVEYGYDVDQYIDADTLDDTNVDASDYGPLFHDEKRETEKEFDRRTFYNTKRKYFKEPQLPNMVTYIEKQQMKHLHEEDPEFWTIGKLAECFPASAEIVKKILKSSFTAYTVEAVLKHDKRVRKNWDLFQKGRLEFDEELRSHYATFVGRLKFETNAKEIKKFLPSPPDFNSLIPRNDFASIISSSRKYQQQEKEAKKHVDSDEAGRVIYTSNSFPVKVIGEEEAATGGSYYTLDSFRDRMKSLPPSRVPGVGKIILTEEPIKQLPFAEDATSAAENLYADSEYSRETEVVGDNVTSAPENPYADLKYSRETGAVDSVGAMNDSFFDRKLARIQVRINIPRKMWQKGKLYRMKDCFYDDTGNFVYRVPGLMF